MDRINQHQLILFAVVCAAISGSLWVAASLMGSDVTTWSAFLVFGLGASGPSLAALVTRVIDGRQREPRARLAPPWLWFPAAIVLGAVPALLASLLVEPSEFWQRITESITDQISGSGGALPFVILYLIAGPLSEEFGWRGYIQPRMRQALTPLTTSVILGLAWAAWHVPLFFLDGTAQSRIGLFTLHGALFLVTMIPLSVMFLYVSETLRGAVWAAVTIHFANNVALTFAPASSMTGSVVVLATSTLFAVVLLLRMRAIGAFAPTRFTPLAAR